MALPNDLVMIRHGQSEANIIQKNKKYQNEIPENFALRHDSHMRLSPVGVQQAIMTGEWLKANHLNKFQACYVSPHVRAMETAAHLKTKGSWIIDDLWRERDWGEYGAGYTKTQQENIFPHSAAMKKQNHWYWKPVGGESLASDVRSRFDTVFNKLKMLENVNTAIGVAHGEFISVARFVLERMTPDEWIRQDKDPYMTIKNGMIIHYSRINPETGDQSHRFKFRRMICPWDETISPFKGQWVELDTHKYNTEELLQLVYLQPNLLSEETN